MPDQEPHNRHNIDAIIAEVHGTKDRINKLEQAFESFAASITGKLDRLFTQPRYEPGRILGAIVQCAVLVGMSVTAVGFVINAYSAAEFARADERQKLMNWRIEQLERAVSRPQAALASRYRPWPS
jgi:hypothetical protein